ncbi:MAG: alpha/beta fold hydrolase [Desulforudis sp.]|jgi:pimeloyl-ACP methyl ester carboxylesterase|nr:alpha/beta fold hydrolase [Clostridia bacterium]MDQ7791195.1 alpha/beta fold hydrolase [Clostridia bacterium]RJX17768.1 MAG: alpha/beta fold hydrolase [Desulforudis sp.]
MTYVSAKGQRLFFQENGEGSPLILIHGLGATHDMWWPQIEAFSGRYRVITYDCRGHGASSFVRPGNSLADLGEDLVALLDHLQIPRAAICGVSFGGVVAQHFALAFPERCGALVIADSFSEVHALDSLGAWLQVPMLRVLPRPLLARLTATAYPRKRWELARTEILKAGLTVRRQEVARLRALLNKVHLTQELWQILCPTLVVVGDRWATMIRYAEIMHKAIPQSELSVIPDACDPSSLTNVEVFNRVVLDFLNRTYGSIDFARSQ